MGLADPPGSVPGRPPRRPPPSVNAPYAAPVVSFGRYRVAGAISFYISYILVRLTNILADTYTSFEIRVLRRLVHPRQFLPAAARVLRSGVCAPKPEANYILRLPPHRATWAQVHREAGVLCTSHCSDIHRRGKNIANRCARLRSRSCIWDYSPILCLFLVCFRSCIHVMYPDQSLNTSAIRMYCTEPGPFNGYHPRKSVPWRFCPALCLFRVCMYIRIA
ncbi:hypothetical protein B0H11DRAFT_2019416 [Mycena galericulata]|nr:hypothetical protein B0H11DRAFT_2019416 [Mycena galericulata]